MATLRSLTGRSHGRGVFDLRSIDSRIRTALAVLMIGVVLLLVVRRLAGAFTEPLSAIGCLLLGGFFTALAVVIRSWAIGIDRFLLLIAASAAVVFGALAISLPQTSALGLLCLWLPIAAGEGWAWRLWYEHRNHPSASTTAAAAIQHVLHDPSEFVADASEDAAVGDQRVTQSLLRRHEDDGSESLSGYLRAHFEPGQRTSNLHIAFCPPLGMAPQCSVETADGPPARVKVTQVLPQGARLEVRLDEDAVEAQQVLVEFSAIERAITA